MPQKGFLTPSSFGDLMTNGRNSDEMGKTALAVIDRLTLDLLGVGDTDIGVDSSSPASIEWGLSHEWEAIELYKDRCFSEVMKPEFRVSLGYHYIGGTADGWVVGTNGGIEVKCPYSDIEHMYNLLYGHQISKYIYQIQGYLYIYGWDWIDFVSYNPRYPEPLQLYVKRVYRDDGIIHKILKRCEMAYAKALDGVNKVTNKYPIGDAV